MFQKLIDKGRCSLGFHSGEWIYESPASCVQVQVCERCAKRSQRTQHGWGEWQFLSEDDCTLQRACPRCGAVESKVQHAWSSDQYYTTPGACETVRICERCSTQEDSGIIHDYSAWEYESDENCLQVLVCERCRAPGNQERLHHAWSAWQYSDFYSAQVCSCSRCGETVVDATAASDPNQIPSLQAAFATLQETLSVDTTPELRQQISAHQGVLFSPTTSYLGMFLEDQGRLTDAERENLESGLALIDACRQHGIDAIFAQIDSSPTVSSAAPQTAANTPPSSEGSLDPSLIGRWRHTSIDSSGSFSQVTDYYMILDGAGDAALSSKTVNTFGEQTSPVEYGRWTASRGYLTIAYPGGEQDVSQYVIEGQTLFFPDRVRKIWERY